MKHNIGLWGLVGMMVAVLLVPPGELRVYAQEAYCREDVELQNKTRRVTGQVNVECGDECFLGICHTAPFGNWGVTSAHMGRVDGGQFAGWKPHGSQRHWNSCTSLYSDSNDGPGKQKAEPDNTRAFAWFPLWHWAGYRQRDACEEQMPETRRDYNVYMKIYELDPHSWIADDDDFIVRLDYGDFSTPITCYSRWDCRGESQWRSRSASNGTGVSARVRVHVRTRLAWD